MAKLAINPTVIRYRSAGITAIYYRGEKIWPEAAPPPPPQVQPIDPVNASSSWESETSATAVLQPDGSWEIAAEEWDSIAYFDEGTNREDRLFTFSGEISNLAGATVYVHWFNPDGDPFFIPEVGQVLTDGLFSIEWDGVNDPDNLSVHPCFTLDDPAASFTLSNFRFEAL